MIKIEFDPLGLVGVDAQWWKRWSVKALQATADAIDSCHKGSEPSYIRVIWSELKAWLLPKVFHGKCGYCEAPVSAVSFGAADHYRPKGEVTIREKGRVLRVVVDGEPHPGYYWLAYNWKNLVPACDGCNSSHKAANFPVGNKHVHKYDASCSEPEALNAVEQPLLLNPYFDQPSNFIRFGQRGAVAAIDDNKRGVATIEILGLDRGALVTERQRSQERAGLKYLVAMCAAAGSGDHEEARSVLRLYASGHEPFTQASLDFIVSLVHSMNDDVVREVR